MKPALQLLLLLLGLAAGPASIQAADRIQQATVSGKKYVRLTDWARANHFAVRWITPEKSLQLSNQNARLVFTVDAREDRTKTWIEGVEVSLASPTIYQKGSAWIAQLDIDETLGPILFPKKNPAGAKIKTICLDPGHGGKDPGFRLGSSEEKKYTLLLAQEVRARLQKAGLDVVLTRSTDYFVPLESRPAVARKRGADLFVSLHFNSVGGSRSQVQGVEVYCLTPAGAFSTNARSEGDTRWVTGNRNTGNSVLLAYQVQKTMLKDLKAADRGVKRARFAVLRDATMPAILIEGGFMSHPSEGKKIFDATYRQRMAQGIVNGILAYKKAVNG